MNCYRCRRRCAVALSLAFLGVAFLWVGDAWSQPPRATSPIRLQGKPASANPCLKFLPKDYWLVGAFDFKAFIEFTTREAPAENPQAAMLKQYMQMAKLLTGIDLEKEVETVAFFVAGNPDKNATGLIAVKGTFDSADAERRLASLSAEAMTTSTYKEKKIHSNEEVGYCLLEDSVLLFGTPGLLRGAIDAAEGPPRALPEGLKNVLDRTNGASIVWAAVRPQVILDLKDLADWRAQNQQLHRSLGKLTCLSAAFEMADDGLLINALGSVAAPGEAKELHKYLSDRRSSLLKKEGSNVFASSALILSELSTTGPYVQGSLRLTERAWNELWSTRVIVKP